MAPARRASVIMFIVGGLMLPCGVIFGVMGGAVDFAKLPPPQAAQFQQIEQQLAASGMTLKQILTLAGAMVAVPGLVLLVLGALVRRGGMGSVVTSIIFCGLVGLVSGLMLVASLAQANGCGAAMWLVMLVAMVSAEVFLFQAAGRAGQLAAYRGGMMPGGYGAGGYPGYPQQQQQYTQGWQQQPGQWGQPPQQQQPGWGAPPPPPPPPPPPGDREG